ncbi:hypothetical protein ES332_A07G154500v1 [Gossypium tomentosum]|uniref:mannan endo-1,4-beta-mannosidase n=1 Tax=Gossypium tomentosum TaxID=34277 RepID=A0A5D2PWE5_GOSTO|nr:hypothetical protein ES332_A07G154500v1 [Gossypium tomentosum]
MMFAVDYSTRNKTGLNVARIWAFDDGDHKPLQSSPGSYNEEVFKGLDFVIAKAQKLGIYMILRKAKYVEWANQHYHNINPNIRNLTEDDFFIDSLTKKYNKNHVKAVLTRNNTITRVVYKDDPTILAWELMSEPRCPSDPTGSNLQSIDNKHLLEIRLEGFYRESRQYLGNISIFVFLQSPLPSTNKTEAEQLAFVDKWIESHVLDSNAVLEKPIVISEFGKSYKLEGYNLDKRNKYSQKIYDDVYNSAKLGGPFVALSFRGTCVSVCCIMEAEINFSLIAPPIFDRDNYQIWTVRMETYLEAIDLWEPIEEDYEIPTLPTSPTVAQIKTQKEKKKRKSKAKTCLFTAVSPTIFTRIMSLKEVKEI